MMPFVASEVSTGVTGVTRSTVALAFAAAGLALGLAGTTPATISSVLAAAGGGAAAAVGTSAASAVSEPRRPSVSAAIARETDRNTASARTERGPIKAR